MNKKQLFLTAISVLLFFSCANDMKLLGDDSSRKISGRTYTMLAQDNGCGLTLIAFEFRDSSTLAVGSGGASTWPTRQKEAIDMAQSATDDDLYGGIVTYQKENRSHEKRTLIPLEFDAKTGRFYLVGKQNWMYPWVLANNSNRGAYIELKWENLDYYLTFHSDWNDGADYKMYFVEPDFSTLPLTESTINSRLQARVEGFTDAENDSANTAKNEHYLTLEEKNMVYYINLCRLYPKKFAELVAEKWDGADKTTYPEDYESLIADLKRAPSNKNPLKVDDRVCRDAKQFGDWLLINKKFTHDRTGSDAKTTIPSLPGGTGVTPHYPRGGENLATASYYKNVALDAVMELLIDRENASKTHRQNIIDYGDANNIFFSHIGVSISTDDATKLIVQDFFTIMP